MVATGIAMAAGGVAGAVIGTALVKRQCKKLYPNDEVKQKKCLNTVAWKRKDL